MNESRIAASVQRRQKVFRDQPETPLERGIFWTEYVLRHGYDTGLRSPTRDMSWFEMYAVNVWLFVVIFFISGILIAIISVRFCIRKLFGSSPLAESKSKLEKRGKGRVKLD